MMRGSFSTPTLSYPTPNLRRRALAQADVVDVAYPPLFQSGGQYNLNLLSKSNDKYLHYGVIICALGAR